MFGGQTEIRTLLINTCWVGGFLSAPTISPSCLYREQHVQCCLFLLVPQCKHSIGFGFLVNYKLAQWTILVFSTLTRCCTKQRDHESVARWCWYQQMMLRWARICPYVHWSAQLQQPCLLIHSEAESSFIIN